MREAAVIAALILAQHPALAVQRYHLAVQRYHLAVHARRPGHQQRRPQPDRQTPVPSIGLVRTHLEQAPETPRSRPLNQIGRDLVNSS
ncbi:hypothetical protein ACIOML_23480 [Streptomyces anulatus]